MSSSNSQAPPKKRWADLDDEPSDWNDFLFIPEYKRHVGVLPEGFVLEPVGNKRDEGLGAELTSFELEPEGDDESEADPLQEQILQLAQDGQHVTENTLEAGAVYLDVEPSSLPPVPAVVPRPWTLELPDMEFKLEPELPKSTGAVPAAIRDITDYAQLMQMQSLLATSAMDKIEMYQVNGEGIVYEKSAQMGRDRTSRGLLAHKRYDRIAMMECYTEDFKMRPLEQYKETDKPTVYRALLRQTLTESTAVFKAEIPLSLKPKQYPKQLASPIEFPEQDDKDARMVGQARLIRPSEYRPQWRGKMIGKLATPHGNLHPMVVKGAAYIADTCGESSIVANAVVDSATHNILDAGTVTTSMVRLAKVIATARKTQTARRQLPSPNIVKRATAPAGRVWNMSLYHSLLMEDGVKTQGNPFATLTELLRLGWQERENEAPMLSLNSVASAGPCFDHRRNEDVQAAVFSLAEQLLVVYCNQLMHANSSEFDDWLNSHWSHAVHCYGVGKKYEVRKFMDGDQFKKSRNIFSPNSFVNLTHGMFYSLLNGPTKAALMANNGDLDNFSAVGGNMNMLVGRMKQLAEANPNSWIVSQYSDNIYASYCEDGKVYWLSIDGVTMESSINYQVLQLAIERQFEHNKGIDLLTLAYVASGGNPPKNDKPEIRRRLALLILKFVSGAPALYGQNLFWFPGQASGTKYTFWVNTRMSRCVTFPDKKQLGHRGNFESRLNNWFSTEYANSGVMMEVEKCVNLTAEPERVLPVDVLGMDYVAVELPTDKIVMLATLQLPRLGNLLAFNKMINKEVLEVEGTAAGMIRQYLTQMMKINCAGLVGAICDWPFWLVLRAIYYDARDRLKDVVRSAVMGGQDWLIEQVELMVVQDFKTGMEEALQGGGKGGNLDFAFGLDAPVVSVVDILRFNKLDTEADELVLWGMAELDTAATKEKLNEILAIVGERTVYALYPQLAPDTGALHVNTETEYHYTDSEFVMEGGLTNVVKDKVERYSLIDVHENIRQTLHRLVKKKGFKVFEVVKADIPCTSEWGPPVVRPVQSLILMKSANVPPLKNGFVPESFKLFIRKHMKHEFIMYVAKKAGVPAAAVNMYLTKTKEINPDPLVQLVRQVFVDSTIVPASFVPREDNEIAKTIIKRVLDMGGTMWLVDSMMKNKALKIYNALTQTEFARGDRRVVPCVKAFNENKAGLFDYMYKLKFSAAVRANIEKQLKDAAQAGKFDDRTIEAIKATAIRPANTLTNYKKVFSHWVQAALISLHELSEAVEGMRPLNGFRMKISFEHGVAYKGMGYATRYTGEFPTSGSRKKIKVGDQEYFMVDQSPSSLFREWSGR